MIHSRLIHDNGIKRFCNAMFTLLIGICFSGCLMPVKKTAVPVRNFSSGLHGNLLIESENTADAYALCELVRKYSMIEGECRGVYDSNSADSDDTVITARIDIDNESGDLKRNAGHSLITLGGYIGVSVSAGVSLSIQDKKNREFQQRGRGRYGLWAFVMPPLGLVGTFAGSVLNTYRKPKKMRLFCMKELEGSHSQGESMESCRNYFLFIESVFLSSEKNSGSSLYAFKAFLEKAGETSLKKADLL